MLNSLIQFVTAYAGWLAAISIASLVIGIISLPFLVTRIPADYFSHGHRQRRSRSLVRWVGRLIVMALKNLLGAALVVAGILMLVLPGQGLLTLFTGLLIMNYPGKFALERWLITRPHVLSTINRLRHRYGHPPLEDP